MSFDWRNSFGEQYLQSIRFICLAMSDEYIDSHFEGSNGEQITLITENYDDSIREVFD